jgi:hypothetical protein
MFDDSFNYVIVSCLNQKTQVIWTYLLLIGD